MLKVLVKKQLGEVFRSYFYDAKKNKMRSKAAIAGWFVFFFVIMVGMLGGMFTGLSLTLCGGLTEAGMGWLYFVLMGGIAIVLGAFGSVFNTYSSLYLAKDNDLLLSLPIPVKTIMTARLINVYLLGAMYSATALLPTLIVYWATTGITAAKAVCGLMLLGIVTLIVLLLSCALGWAVAKISLRLKNKSFVTVLVSIAFIGAYYFFYFRANDLIKDILLNAEVYGARIKGAARGLYLFGRIGEGDWLGAAVYAAVTAALFAAVWIVMSRSFLNIATATGATAKAWYVEKPMRKKSLFGALLGKEFARFAASPNYMLNCGLSTLLLPALGVLLLIKGREICAAVGSLLSAFPDSAAVLACAMLCLVSSMNDMAVPAVSLEGKSLWIPQSLPIPPGTALRAKAAVQLILTEIPLLFAAVCAAAVVPASPLLRVLICLTPLIYAAFSALSGVTLGVRMPLLSWTDETAPIKQSGAVAVAVFGSWGISIAVAGLYLLIGYKIGAAPYLLIFAVLFAAAALFLLRWLDRKGSRIFSEL